MRPTRSKEELKRIVEVTKDKVTELIQASTNKSKSAKSEKSGNGVALAKTDKRSTEKFSTRGHGKGKWWRNQKYQKKTLTKKERNRKAAILLARRQSSTKRMQKTIHPSTRIGFILLVTTLVSHLHLISSFVVNTDRTIVPQKQPLFGSKPIFMP